MCAHACIRLHSVPACVGLSDARVCLLGGLPLSQVNARLIFQPLVLGTSLYVEKLTWALGGGQWLRHSYPGGRSKDPDTGNTRSLRPGQVASLKLAGSSYEESPSYARPSFLLQAPARSSSSCSLWERHRGVFFSTSPWFCMNRLRGCSLTFGIKMHKCTSSMRKS